MSQRNKTKGDIRREKEKLEREKSQEKPNPENEHPMAEDENIEDVDVIEEVQEPEETEHQENIETEPVQEATSQPSNNNVRGGYNPLDEAVKEKPYSRPNVNIGSNPAEIDEPVFNAPTIDLNESEPTKSGESSEGATKEGEQGSTMPPNTSEDTQDPAAKKQGAEMLADTFIHGYKRLHQLGQWYVKIEEGELVDLYLDGKLTPDLQIPLDDAGTKFQSLATFVEEYNSQASEALSVDDSFVKDVRPPLIRVLIKNGWGMTDEQYLMTRVGEDLATKASMVFSFKKNMNRTLRMFSKYYMENLAPGAGEQREAPPVQEPAQQTTANNAGRPEAEAETTEVVVSKEKFPPQQQESEPDSGTMEPEEREEEQRKDEENRLREKGENTDKKETES